MSTVKRIPARSRYVAISASTSSSVVPCASSSWIASASIPIPTDADSVSTRRIRSPSSAAASDALWNVPDSLAEMCSE